MILSGNEAQKKKYLGRMTEEPLAAVSVRACEGGGVCRVAARVHGTCAGLLRDRAWSRIGCGWGADTCCQARRQGVSTEWHFMLWNLVMCALYMCSGSLMEARCGSQMEGRLTGTHAQTQHTHVRTHTHTRTHTHGLGLVFCRYFVLAKTDPNERPHKAFSGFIVDADAPGVSFGKKVGGGGGRGQRGSLCCAIYCCSRGSLLCSSV